MRKRTNQIIVHLNDEELLLLRRKLQDSGLSMVEFFHNFLYNGEIRIYPNDFLKDVQRQVKGVGVNVNQMTRLAHTAGKVSLETLQQISAAQEKIEQQFKRLNNGNLKKHEEVRKVDEMTTAELNQYLENIAKLIEATAEDADTAAQIVRDSKVTA